MGKGVRVHELDPGRIEGVGRQVLARHLERRRRALDRDDARRAAGERVDGEAAGVAEAVEHFAPCGERAHALAVFALVEKEAGLLALLDVDPEIQPVFDDRAARRGAVAAHEARARLEAFELARLGIGALVDRLAAGELGERIEDRIAPALDAGGEKLGDQHVGIAVDDQAGQAVRFRVHQAQRIRVLGGGQALAHGKRAHYPVAEERGIDLLGRIEGPDPRADLRRGAVRRARPCFPGSVAHLDGIAALRLVGDALDRAGKDPRMAAAQRFLAPGFEVNHFFRARGCAAS